MNPYARGFRTKTSRRLGRHITLLGLAASLVGMAFVSVSPAAVGSKSPLKPPGNVYTCPWIAEHPREAEQAGVSCDEARFSAASLHISSKVYPFMDPLDSGCHYYPFDGSWIGQGVFVWTSYKYSDWWQWYEELPVNGTSAHDYTWYVQKPGNITYVYDHVTDGAIHGTGVINSNNYRWGAQNHVNNPRRYFVCWDTR